MKRPINPFLATDGYKTGHKFMYPEGTTLVQTNFTPRSGKHAKVNMGGVINFGTQMVMMQIFEIFQNGFFNREKLTVLNEVKDSYEGYLGMDYDTSHIAALYDLGYLPIELRALPEGKFSHYGVPVLTVINTKPEFYWLPTFLETLISNLMWLPITSASTAAAYYEILLDAALTTDEKNVPFVSFQGHDFSMRGQASLDATIASSLGHALYFRGSDSLPAIYGAREYYGMSDKDVIVNSVPATEHAVMCAGTKDDEVGTFRRLMETFPTGILSVVSDTWDLWKVCTEYLPELKEEILARDGKLVIRPDSGDPVDILCGWRGFDPEAESEEARNSPQNKGVIELLWEVFGGTTNDQGYKVLDSHIGAIYGDSITPERAEQICGRLEAKGFASTNVVLGIGSYTYQFVTRDTHGLACKSTYVEVDGEPREIFKDPVTDDGTKKSAKGAVMVVNGQLVDQVPFEETLSDKNELKPVFRDGKFLNLVTFEQIRENA